MLVVVAFVLVVWASVLSDRVASHYDKLFDEYQSKARQMQMVKLSEHISRYVTQKGAYPASLAAFAATPGFEDAAAQFNNWQGYAVSPALTDAVWTYRRAIVFTVDPTRGETAATYLAANACGVGGYDTATSWCGSKKSMWYRQENRDIFNEQIVNERSRMGRLAQKFASYFNAASQYPAVDGSSVALAANSLTSFASLAGYVGTATNCTGQYQYQGIPIDCSDMFNSWGQKVAYQFTDATHAILVSETQIVSATGVPIIISVDLT